MRYVQFGFDVPLTNKDTTWKEDQTGKFANPSLKNVANSTLKSAYSDFAMPLNWKKPVYELDPYVPENNANLNTDLIVWMRISPFPNFRKLHRRVSHTGAHFGRGLPKGSYRMDILYSILSVIQYSI